MFSDARKALKATANRRGLILDRQIAVERQDRLLDALRPWQTEHPLIRIGGDHDGGYLLPDDLQGIVACFSPGVSDQSSFEEDILARGIRCFQADASVERSPAQDHPLVEFERKFIGPVTEGEFTALSDWVAEKQPIGDLLLQMDIEGAEWLALAATADRVLGRFRIVCIELHGLEHLFEPFAFSIMEQVLQKLLRQFYVVHAHPNNWCETEAVGSRRRVPGVLEYTFLRKDRVRQKSPATLFPHPLDQDCRADAPTVALPASMVRGDSPGPIGE
ncbi:FkbM family methyltransferase [Sphingomonas sp.]|uniref:FkbM family methyltransferase n=1 Tax=Sphingomonas sp. TaxID=28214 RepID=UPI00389DD065